MKIIKLFIWVAIFILPAACLPFDKIYSHDFNDGYFKLKSSVSKPENIYLSMKDDSLKVYSVHKENKLKLPDTIAFAVANLKSVVPGNILYNSTFIKTSADIDLSTVILKFRPTSGNRNSIQIKN